MTVLLKPEQHWTCPNCVATDVTYETDPHTRMHACKGLKGLTAPMVPDGTKCKIEAVERGDYVKQEIVTKDGEGRPIMSVVTTREDGQDCAVYAPLATASAREVR